MPVIGAALPTDVEVDFSRILTDGENVLMDELGNVLSF